MSRARPIIALITLLVALGAPQVALARASSQGLLLKLLTFDQARARTRENPDSRESESEALRLANFAFQHRLTVPSLNAERLRRLHDLARAGREPKSSQDQAPATSDRDELSSADRAASSFSQQQAPLPPPHARFACDCHPSQLSSDSAQAIRPRADALFALLTGRTESPSIPRAPPHAA